MGTHRLAPDSLAFALLQASRAVEAVILGRNLDVALAREADAAALPATTRAAVQDLAYATLRDYGRGDFYLGRLLVRPLDAPLVRALLLIALHARAPGAGGAPAGLCRRLVSVQDAGAQRAARYLDLVDGQRVLDACAAPGGKTSHILETADVDAHRARYRRRPRPRVSVRNLERLGLTGRGEDRRLPRGVPLVGRPPFDRILADVPCSASGVVRRNPDIKWLRRSDDIARFARTAGRDPRCPVAGPRAGWQNAVCRHARCLPKRTGSRSLPLPPAIPIACRLPIAGQPDCQYLPSTEHDGFFYALLEKAA
jgi:16S rRNA (cytosine967-C5)-methyltransferase